MQTTDIEKKSLEAHVELCAQRYNSLEANLAELKTNVVKMEVVITEVHDMVGKLSEKNNDRLINWGIVLMGGLISIIGWLLTKYVFV